MTISIRAVGGTNRQRALAEKVGYWCVREMLPRHRTLDVEIQLNKCLEEGAYGFCYAMDTDREFTIEVDKRIDKFKNGKTRKNGRDIFIETVCHEFVHVMQTAKGIMIDRVYPKKLGYRKLWKSARTGKYVDHTNTPYSKLPWETQAYKMQDKLLKNFKKFEEKG